MAHHVCPWWLGHLLACPLRRLRLDPRRILAPFVRPGAVVLEPGCGMGFFTLDLVHLVGPTGRVVAVDIQPRMLAGLRRRATRAGLGEKIDIRLAADGRLAVEDLAGQVDFALAFYVVHEVSDQQALFSDIAATLGPEGTLLVVEPLWHVSALEFAAGLAAAARAGLEVVDRPRIGVERTALLAPTAQ
jgi:ubiquinone/menaquinone biosynthesis C-methylase UbiE